MPEKKNHRRRMVPYIGAVVGVALGYGSVLVLTGQQMLAVGTAVVTALAGYLVSWFIQMRGRLTLRLTAIGLPLLVALACVLFMRLTPYLDRQKAIGQLKEAGIGFSARPPDRAGEWLQDRSGNMLPVWLANWIGPECMAEVRNIDADWTKFARVDFAKLQTSKLMRFTLRRDDEAPPLSEELIAWCNSCPELGSVWLDLSHFSQADADAVASLNKNCGFQIDLDTATGAVHKLPAGSSVSFTGELLTVEYAEQIVKLPQPKIVGLNFATIQPGALQVISGFDQALSLTVTNARFSMDDLAQLASPPRRSISLSGVTLPAGTVSETTASGGAGVEFLALEKMTVSLPQIENVCRLLNCRNLRLWQALTDAELATIWSTTDVGQISCFVGNDWQHFSRQKASSGSTKPYGP